MSALKSLISGAGILTRLQISHRISVIASRQLFGNNVLAIDTFLEQREKVNFHFREMREKYFTRMRDQVVNAEDKLVFTEDLKHMIHLVDNKPEEIQLLVQMIHLYTKQNKELRFSTYVFGPVVMRCLHHFGMEQIVYQLITDSNCGSFFDQISTYVLAMDILFKKEKYDEVVELFEQLKVKQLRSSTFHRDSVILYLAALYKLNTPEALKLACKLITEAKEKDAFILRKGLIFAAALALKQEAPEKALEIISTLQHINYFSIKNIRLVILAKLNRLSECLDLLKTDVERDSPKETTPNRHQYCDETLSVIREAIVGSNVKSDLVGFDRLVKSLREERLVTNESLDSMVSAPILMKGIPKTDYSVGGYEAQFFKTDRNRTGNGRTNMDSRKSRQSLFNMD
ncbi:hypothetical protein CHUAL_002684 [Chamberlinius hualienensis]